MIEPCSAATVRARLADFVELLRDGVDGGASMSFVAPLDTGLARAFWTRVAGEVEAGKRLVLGAFEGDRLVGSVQLSLDMPPNQPHRVDLQKMLVHSAMRRRGLGRRLLAAADDAVRAAGRSLIVLDTVRGSDAESVYARCGYTRVGVIPGFALNHDGSALADTVIFFRSSDRRRPGRRRGAPTRRCAWTSDCAGSSGGGTGPGSGSSGGRSTWSGPGTGPRR